MTSWQFFVKAPDPDHLCNSRLFGLSWLGALYFRAIIRFNLKAPDPDHLCNSPLIPVCSATMLLTEDHV
ncbi:hypothetical protein GBAR_LOCUS8404 [Geodia barretti]|uniref:Uncharacterized protein n=1 Tax=Geodia barretti TaxID=519541 RepID=A0AA35RKH5_GEOBA|nr:hypothetical protein GBAR_LOCUS8404 [Geodia barretti]